MILCRICRGETEGFLNLGNQALSDFQEDASYRPPHNPLHVYRCNTCGLVQLSETTPRFEMYHNRYGFKSGVNESIRDDLHDAVDQGLKYQPDAQSWLDIACNDGTLLSYVPKQIWRAGIDPVAKYADEARQYSNQMVSDYFDPNYFTGQKFDVITSISMFYDIDDPNTFVENVKRILAEDGIWIIQQNYLLSMIEQGAVDNISHEHITYFSLRTLRNLLQTHGLQINDVQTSSVNGGSFRSFVSRTGEHPVRPAVQEQLDIEDKAGLGSIEIYHAFAVRALANLKELHELVVGLCDQGKIIYLLGASTRGATIWQAAGLDGRYLKRAIERNPEKVGLHMSSVGVPIISEDEGRRDHPDYMLVGPWFFRYGLISREASYLRRGGQLIFPLPEVEIVSHV